MNLSEKITGNFNKKGWRKIRRRISRFVENRRYQKWIRRVENKPAARESLSEQTRRLPVKPLISVILPVYNIEEKWLRRCVESVRKQIYQNWELCVADDCSPNARVREILSEYAAQDERIKVFFRAENGHISAASNSALQLATGEFCALLDHDDELAEDALFYLAAEINRFPEAQMIYSDEDMIDERGRRYDPKFKPDWSRDLFYSLNLITHLAAFRTEILRRINGWRAGFEGSQDYDLALRFIEQIPESDIRHIPHILYHWRAIRGSVALDADEKPYAHERARQAVAAHLERTGKKAKVSRAFQNLHRVRYDLPSPSPKVNLILLADEDGTATARAVKTFAEATEYQNFEINLICSAAMKVKLESENLRQNAKIIVCEKKSEAEKRNVAAARTDGEVLCFVDLNLRPAAKDWLEELIGFAVQTEIGAAGAKITDANETILHGGIVLGVDDFVGFAHRGFSSEFGGSLNRAQVVNNFSAVAIDCLATRRDIFLAAGGFDAEHFPDTLFDFDFCLKLRAANRRVVWTPHAELIKVERRPPLNSQKNPTAAERDFFKRKWRGSIDRDPFYNPNLSRRNVPFALDV